MTKQIMIIADYTHTEALTLDELCETCGVSTDFIYDLLEYEIIKPTGHHPEEWLFDLNQLQRIKTTLRLQRDLEINLAGIALILDLLDEIHTLQARVEFLEKYF